MPSKYVPKTKKGRRSYRRTFRRKTKLLSFTKAPIPNKFATKLRYASSKIVTNSPPTFPGLQVVTANGLFDPDITGVGHQPRGFDQFMQMYDHYTVVGSKITVHFAHKTATEAQIVGIALKDASGVASLNDYLEGRNIFTTSLPNDSNAKVTLSKTFSAKKFLGVSHPLSASNLRGSTAGNPGEQAYFHIVCDSVTGSTSVTVDVYYVIDYLVIFTEPVQPGQS